MKLRLRRHETRETLKLVLADTATLHDLQLRINRSAPTSVHLSLNRKDELLSPSPKVTLRSLGVISGDLIYYSLDRSVFPAASIEEIGFASTAVANQALAPNGESEKNQMVVGFAETGVEDPAEGSIGESSGMDGPDPMDVEQLDVELAVAGRKRLNEPFFLKKLLVEKYGDTSELTTLAMSVHAVMFESGFVLLNPFGSDKFSFSKELLTVPLKYTLPELMVTRNETDVIEFVTVTFQSLSDKVVVYGSLGEKVHRVSLDKRRFLPVIDSFDKMFMFWRMVKDGLVIPLMIGLCDKSGLELPPCLMRLPTELKLKILESLPGASVAKMACVCTEIRYLASDNDLWKRKCLEEAENLVVDGSGDLVNWKEKFAAFWRQHQRELFTARQQKQQFYTARQTLRNNFMRRSRVGSPRIINDTDPFGLVNEDYLYESVGIQPGQPHEILVDEDWDVFLVPISKNVLSDAILEEATRVMETFGGRGSV